MKQVIRLVSDNQIDISELHISTDAIRQKSFYKLLLRLF